jgi:hypothetical protein
MLSISSNFLAWFMSVLRGIVSVLDSRIHLFGLRFSVFWLVLGVVAFVINLFLSIISRRSAVMGGYIANKGKKVEKMISLTEIINRLFIIPFDYGTEIITDYVPSVYDGLGWYVLLGCCILWVFTLINKFFLGGANSVCFV